MGILKKIFGNLNKEKNKEDYRSKYSPTIDDTPADERFAIKFTGNGGKFIYCESEVEVAQSFASILRELGPRTTINCANNQLKEIFNMYEHLFTQDLDKSNVFLTNCEYLIANDGSILLSSNQLNQKKMPDLPATFIVYATTSQMVNDLSESMRGINSKYHKKKPSGITAFKNFGVNQDDFRNYGSCPKKMYLVLMEDLTN